MFEEGSALDTQGIGSCVMAVVSLSQRDPAEPANVHYGYVIPS